MEKKRAREKAKREQLAKEQAAAPEVEAQPEQPAEKEPVETLEEKRERIIQEKLEFMRAQRDKKP